MSDKLKEQVQGKVNQAKEGAAGAFASVFKGVDQVKEPPRITSDEVLVERSRESKALMYCVGVVLTFIPPFIWGPLLILAVYYFSSTLILTDRRLVAYQKSWKPGFFMSVEIPLKHLAEVRVGPRDLVERIFGQGSLLVKWESTERGSSTNLFPSYRRPKKLVAAIQSAADRAKGL